MNNKKCLIYFPFEKLTVWIDSKELVKSIYSVTLKFPNDEKFGSTSQQINIKNGRYHA
ncbi:four helix bundle protein [Gelidibacter salicanalis]|uniref:Four helix bundle protein n=1 Tax=Gelidibacter salicanalis TaxID=291193 RepID=A0A934KTG2_9FLAO|nr:four helix bundle protein [Gelidibacter salicanalis]